MRQKNIYKMKVTALTLTVFFIFSIIQFPLTAEASGVPVSESVQPLFQNPLSQKIIFDEVASNKWTVKTADSRIKLETDRYDPSRIYSLTENQEGKVISLRYLYDDIYQTVTVLLSFSEEGMETSYTYYYRYALGPNTSLELILEEGWIKEETLIPSRFYDYYPYGIQVRFFDRTGNLLRIDTSEGIKKHFIYSRNGQLLTIKETDILGNVTFFDQVFAALKKIKPTSPFENDDKNLFIVPSREPGKRLGLIAFRNPDLDFGLNSHHGHLADTNSSGRFLEWLVAAHPLRAGPMKGGELK